MFHSTHILAALLVGLLVPSQGRAHGPHSALDEDALTGSSRDSNGDPIINGESAGLDDYPMSGAILSDVETNIFGTESAFRTFTCSSTLIAPDAVLTAAHCVDPFQFTFGMSDLDLLEFVWSPEEDMTAYNGASSDTPWPASSWAVETTVSHPEFRLEDVEMGLAENHDIALMFLSEPVLDTRPAILPTVEEAASVVSGLEVAVVGWGVQVAASGMDPVPEGANLLKQYGQSFVAEVDAFEFQVGAEESDVRKCHGDSGGPTFASIGSGSEETARLIGLTSHAFDVSDCASTGGVDTRVDHYLEWIDAEMRAACADGTRVWCDEPGILPADYFDAEQQPSFEDTGLDGVDTGELLDTGAPSEVEDESDDESGFEGADKPETVAGCGCSAANHPIKAMWAVAFVAVLGMRRRR